MLLDITEPVTAILVVVLGILLYKALSKPARFPPGPPALPFVGSIHFLPDKENMGELAKKYGNIVGAYIGQTPAVYIFDFKMAKDILNKDVFSGRPFSFKIKARSFFRRYGLVMNDGPEWQEQRRFALRTLKDFGFGKKGLEGVLHDELQSTVDYFRENSSKPLNMQNVFNVTIINVLWTIVASKRFSFDDPHLREIIALMTEDFQSEVRRIVNFIPWTRHILPEKWSGWKRMQNLNGKICSELKDTILEHRESYQENNMRDFMDVYLREIQKNEKKSFHEDQMIIVCLDLFEAGAETTSTTLTWAILFMILNPDVQQKVQKEIDEVIGQNRLPSFEDRGKLPYTEATIMEIQRLGSIVPNSLAHRTTDQVELEGYLIPKSAMVLYSLYYIGRDKKYWDEPEIFNPERFIDAQGKLNNNEALIPFGTGKRKCLGESLAKLELFYFFTGLLQNFTFSHPINDPPPTVKGRPGFIRGPQPYRALVKPRF